MSERAEPSFSVFASSRERRLWGWTLAVVVAIYSTLGFAQTLSSELRDRGLISDLIWVGLFLIAVAVGVAGLSKRPGIAEIGVAVGVAGAYLIALLRMALPEERSHIIEYTVVALLMHEALLERNRGGRWAPYPALIALVAASLVGLFDECIQFYLPSRVFDTVDIGFNFLSALMAVTSSVVLRWVRVRAESAGRARFGGGGEGTDGA